MNAPLLSTPCSCGVLPTPVTHLRAVPNGPSVCGNGATPLAFDANDRSCDVLEVVEPMVTTENEPFSTGTEAGALTLCAPAATREPISAFVAVHRATGRLPRGDGHESSMWHVVRGKEAEYPLDAA